MSHKQVIQNPAETELGEVIDCLRQGKPELLNHDSACAIAEHLDMLDNKIFDLLQDNKALKERLAIAEAGQGSRDTGSEINLNNLPQTVRLKLDSQDHVAFDDTYLESGMILNIINVHRREDYDDPGSNAFRCYGVTFDSEPYYDHNLSLMPRVYYPTIHTPKNTNHELFTAVEAGYYEHHETLFFYIDNDAEDPLISLANQLKELMVAVES